jgi:hypothetical protein
MFFWVVTPCGLVGRYQRFGETYWLHLQPRRWRHYVSPKRSRLKMETVRFFETFSPEDGDSMFLRNVSTYESTRRHDPQAQHRHSEVLFKTSPSSSIAVSNLRSSRHSKESQTFVNSFKVALNCEGMLVLTLNLMLEDHLLSDVRDCLSKLNFATEYLALLLRIREVSGSNLSPKTGCPDWGCSWFFSVPPGTCRYSTLTYATTDFFQILSNSLTITSFDAV